MDFEDVDIDDDNLYSNPVAILKALKKKSHAPKEKSSSLVDPEEVQRESTLDDCTWTPSPVKKQSKLGRRKKPKQREQAEEDNDLAEAIAISSGPAKDVIEIDCSPPMSNYLALPNSQATVRRSNRIRGRSASTEIKTSVPVREDDPILLDSDCEAESPDVRNVSLIDNNDESKTEDDYPVDIKILWRSRNIIRFTLNKDETLHKVFEHLADQENIPKEQILMLKGDRTVTPFDTPASLNITILDILDAGVINAENVITNAPIGDEDTCKIKVQTANSKEDLTFPLKKDQPFEVIFQSCSEKLNVPLSSIKMYFDGEQIGPTDTPESLDLDEDACVDLKIVN